MPPTRLPDKEKIDKYLDAVSSRAGEVDPRLASCMTCAKPILGRIAQLIGCCAPFYVWLYKWAFLIYTWLPKQATLALFGFALCFFGGTYVASIAAIEAFRQMGFAKVQEARAALRSRHSHRCLSLSHRHTNTHKHTNTQTHT